MHFRFLYKIKNETERIKILLFWYSNITGTGCHCIYNKARLQSISYPTLNITSDWVFLTLISDGGGGLNMSTLILFVKIIEKYIFWAFFCIVKYSQN